MVADILNLRTSPKSSTASLPSPAARNGDEAPGAAAASGGDTALAAQILEGLRKKELVVPGETSEDKEWAYAKEITTSECSAAPTLAISHPGSVASPSPSPCLLRITGVPFDRADWQ